MKKVWEEFDKVIAAMEKEMEDFKKEINDPEEKKKVEEAISKGTKKAMDQRNLLIDVAKKLEEWGLAEYDTTLGPKPITCWRFDKFKELVTEHKKEVRDLMLPNFPKMPEIEGDKQILEIVMLLAMSKVLIMLERHPEDPEELWENCPQRVVPKQNRQPSEGMYCTWVHKLEELARKEKEEAEAAGET